MLNLSWLTEMYHQILRNEIFERDNSIHVKLELKKLWQEFAAIGTEMIITKYGR